MHEHEHTTIPVKLSNGRQLPPGSTVTWCKGIPTIHGRPKALDGTEGDLVRLPMAPMAAARALGIEIPSGEQVGRWVAGDFCESILGHRVEPDGIDPHGSPSWLRAMGLV